MTSDERPTDEISSSNSEGGRRFVGVPAGRRAVAAAAVLVGGGAIAGGVLASTIGASAAPGGTAQPAAASSDPATPPASAAPHIRGDGPGRPAAGSAGTVTAVGTGTVSIKTSTATTTYSVTSTTTIFKGGVTGKASLADVKVGDTVFFDTTASGSTVLARLFDGKLPGRGPGGPANGVRPLTGTVTAVGTSTVTIKTTTATTTYSVTSTTTIEKFAQGSLDGVKVGDTVSFETTTTGGTVLAHLMDGKPAFGGPGGGPGGHGFGGPGGHGFGGPGGPPAGAGAPVTPGGTTT
jgi:hypothetical protein